MSMTIFKTLPYAVYPSNVSSDTIVESWVWKIESIFCLLHCTFTPLHSRKSTPRNQKNGKMLLDLKESGPIVQILYSLLFIHVNLHLHARQRMNYVCFMLQESILKLEQEKCKLEKEKLDV